MLLAIESSCDDTSAAVMDAEGRLLSNVVATQEMHRRWGGVVPEAASRAHLSNIVPVVDEALRQAGCGKNDLRAIAFTRGPGLPGSLHVGVSFAKGLGLALGIPIVEVHHIQAHILAHFLEEKKPSFPFLCLTVAGGHTQIVRIDSPISMTILGKTIDDAAGEAFDKTGKLLGLDYPAGPIIDRLARQGTPRFAFPEPAIPHLDFSFSGLKTNILRFLEKNMRENPAFVQENLSDICASVQERIVSILLNKLEKAALQTDIRDLALAGGVSANSGLRSGLTALAEKHGWQCYVPRPEHCTDNAAMVAMAGHFKWQAGLYADQEVTAEPHWALTSP
jgi:N6-L-threonylcarbamoyladenine synthase